MPLNTVNETTFSKDIHCYKHSPQKNITLYRDFRNSGTVLFCALLPWIALFARNITSASPLPATQSSDSTGDVPPVFGPVIMRVPAGWTA